jgi:hypothetical protein
MKTRLGFLVAAVVVSGCGNPRGAGAPGAGVPPEDVAEFVHTVIEAHRTVYAEDVVYRLQDQAKVIKATEHFEQDKTLPLPAQMLRMSAQVASDKGRLRYALISPYAINKANNPKTDFERIGMDAVLASPDVPYTSYETVGDRRYFIAIYADRAVSDACVSCHNNNDESPKHDFKRGDVMGGIVISVPLER